MAGAAAQAVAVAVVLVLVCGSSAVVAFTGTCPSTRDGCRATNNCTVCHDSCGLYCQSAAGTLSANGTCTAAECVTCPCGCELVILDPINQVGNCSCPPGVVDPPKTCGAGAFALPVHVHDFPQKYVFGLVGRRTREWGGGRFF